MGTYIWCEDSTSGFMFWTEIFKSINSKFIVESKRNNSNLRKAIKELTDTENQYYILIDNAIDNPDVLREVKYIQNYVSQKSNVSLVNIHSFEFVLLSFEWLVRWVFAEQDELKTKRESLIRAREIFVDIFSHGGTAEQLAQFKQLFGFSEAKNSEQISAKLLFEITRNTGFETNKGKLGSCFISNCCDLTDRKQEDLCGLQVHYLTADEKMRQIIEHSAIQNAFSEAKLL